LAFVAVKTNVFRLPGVHTDYRKERYGGGTFNAEGTSKN
jgi:hypothetical protein